MVEKIYLEKCNSTEPIGTDRQECEQGEGWDGIPAAASVKISGPPFGGLDLV